MATKELNDIGFKAGGITDPPEKIISKLGYLCFGFTVGVTVGFAAGYYIAEQKLKTRYSQLANEEISRMREHYVSKMVASQPKPPVDQVKTERTEHVVTEEEQEAIDEANRLYPSDEEEVEEAAESEEVPEVSEKLKNVFTEPEDDWDYAVETRLRSKDAPYIIHLDEFKQNEPEHDQVTYTYYEVDDVLANTRSMQIEDMDETVGLGNLARWGHGSHDENIVYVRNEKLGLDFEILRDRGSYAETLRGTIRHSSEARRRRPNRRFDDDA